MGTGHKQLQFHDVIAEFLRAGGTSGFAALPRLRDMSDNVPQFYEGLGRRVLLGVVKDPESLREGFIGMSRIREKLFHEGALSWSRIDRGCS